MGDYPLDVGLRKYHQGLYPSHNLFGLVELPDLGISTTVAQHAASPFLDRIARRLGLGNSIASQLSVLRIARRGDIIFSICLPSSGLLALLKRVGFLRHRLLTLVHHPVKPSRMQKFILGSNDRLFFFSKHALDSCRQVHGLNHVPMTVLPWGPQIDFFAPTPLPEGPFHIVAAGKSSRDYRTLIEAARQTAVRVTIVCPHDRLPDMALPPNVHIIGGSDGSQPLEERELSDLYRSAHVIAVPLVRTQVLAGLTSLLDALAIHRPAILTRNPNIDIDVEAEQVGWWTEPEDVASWVRAIVAARHDRALLQTMATNAGNLAARQDIRNFAKVLKAEILSTSDSRSQP